MTSRLDYARLAPELFRKLVDFGLQLARGAIDATIRDLVAVRASQLNGCAFCLDMHVKQARIHGERELRLHHLAMWRESALYSPRERAALAWTELLTRLPEHGVPDDAYDRARSAFSERELAELTYLVATTNAWNRLNVAFRGEPGSRDAEFGLGKAG